MTDTSQRTEFSNYIGSEISVTTAPNESASGILKSVEDKGIIIDVKEMWLEQSQVPSGALDRPYFFPWTSIRRISLPR